jgi:uncharacterized protein
MALDSDAGPRLVDHHCHGVIVEDLGRSRFEALMNEAARPSPLGTTLFESMEGLALRRWCAPVLDLEPLASAADYLARRLELGAEEVARRFLTASATAEFLVDGGYTPDSVTTAEELAALAGGRSHHILRLESIAQDLLAGGVEPSELPDRVVQALQESTALGAKSIAAYRVGLALPATKPSLDTVVNALAAVQQGPDGAFRIAHPAVNGWLAWTAIEVGLPLQFHVGYGDSDVDLHECDPLLLTGFLRATEDRGVPVLLLHNYPFHRNAGYLAQVFDHVFMDVGLATHNTGALSVAVVREALELAPFGKMLYSSDAYGLPELYHLGSTLFRRALSGVLETLMDDGQATRPDADRITALVCAENASRVYRLPPAPG